MPVIFNGKVYDGTIAVFLVAFLLIGFIVALFAKRKSISTENLLCISGINALLSIACALVEQYIFVGIFVVFCLIFLVISMILMLLK